MSVYHENNAYIHEAVTSLGFVRAVVTLCQVPGQRAYFSVQCDVWTNKAVARRHPLHPHTCGRVTEDVVAVLPDLADAVALQLSDIDGVPLHADANGWWWIVQGERAKVAELLRVPLAELPATFTRESFTEYVNAQRPRWQDEAKAAIARYGLTLDSSEA